MMSKQMPASMPPSSATPTTGQPQARGARVLGFVVAGIGCTGLGVAVLRRHARMESGERKKEKRRLRLNHATITAICGGFAECASVVATYPLETIKVRCQMSGIGAMQAVHHLVTSNGSDVIRITRSLYSGVTPAALAALVVGATYLSIFSFSETLVRKAERAISKDKNQDHGNVGSEWRESSELAAGLSAALASFAVTCIELPVEMTRLRLQSGTYTGGVSCLVQGVWRDMGVSGAMTYLAPCLAKEIPQDATEFVAYGKLTRVWDQTMPSKADESQGSEWLIGAAAGAAAALVSLPADVLKTRLSCVSPAELHGGKFGFIKSYAFAARTVYQECGIMGFFAGIAPRLIKVPSAMIYWVTIEAARRVLTKNFGEGADTNSSDT